jgi:hypothetical protein
MIKTRIAGTAAVFTFGLAALGGAVVAIAAPANAAPASEHAARPSKPSGPAHLDPKFSRTQTHLIPGFKPSVPAHLIPGVKPKPITNGPTSGLGTTSANRPVERDLKQLEDEAAKRYMER